MRETWIMGAAQAEARGGVVVPWSCQRTGARGMIDKAALGKLSAATSINRDLMHFISLVAASSKQCLPGPE